MRDLKLFGLWVIIPMLLIVEKKLDKDREALLASYMKEMGTCKRCHKLLEIKAGMKFILHLQDHHNASADNSYKIIAEVYSRMDAARRGKC